MICWTTCVSACRAGRNWPTGWTRTRPAASSSGRHPKSIAQLNALFAKGEVDKTYVAVTRGAPEGEAGRIDQPLAKRSPHRGWWMQGGAQGNAGRAGGDHGLAGCLPGRGAGRAGPHTRDGPDAPSSAPTSPPSARPFWATPSMAVPPACRRADVASAFPQGGAAPHQGQTAAGGKRTVFHRICWKPSLPWGRRLAVSQRWRTRPSDGPLTVSQSPLPVARTGGRLRHQRPYQYGKKGPPHGP